MAVSRLLVVDGGAIDNLDIAVLAPVGLVADAAVVAGLEDSLFEFVAPSVPKALEVEVVLPVGLVRADLAEMPVPG